MTAPTPDNFLDMEALAGIEGKLAVAVSGGSDSVALLHLLHDLGQFELSVVTVDHQLRAASQAEAAGVRLMAHELGLSHATLMWDDPPRRNIQDAARRARRQLISEWAADEGIAHVALGHTADDQAETFLLRLARGSGVEGLSGMDAVILDRNLTWVRPLLQARREELRGYLSARGVDWVDDPSNEDERFDRVKMRKALGALSDAGISVPKIANTTKRLKSARAVLYTATRDLSRGVTHLTDLGELEIEITRFTSAQPTMKLRLLSEAIRFVAGAYYTPRAHAVTEIIEALGRDEFTGVSLGGCLLRSQNGKLIVRREPGRTGDAVAIGTLWDERWMLSGQTSGDLRVDALGDAVSQINEWRSTGHSREGLMTSPAVWRGAELVAAPLAGLLAGYTAKFCPRNPFFTP